jgi:uncharacterized iron-regulated membrane protein
MDGPAGWFFLCSGLVTIGAVLAAFVLWWARREESQGLVKVAAILLVGPWALLLPLGPGALIGMLGFRLESPTGWLSPAVGLALVILSRHIRRKEAERRDTS